MRLNALLILALLLPGLLFSLTHTVKLDGSGDFTSIQAAVDAAAQGDTVLAYPGRYFENIVIQTNGISLISLEASTWNPVFIDSTIVDGMSLGPCIRVFHSITGICIRGFSFTNGLNIGSGGGMLLSSGSDAVITNCKVYGNTASAGGGINVIGASAYLSGVMIYDNYSVNLGGGLYCSSVSGFVHSIVFDPVNRCSIYNNRSGAGQDIYMQHAISDLNVYLDTFSVAAPTTYYAIYIPEGLQDHQMHFDILNAHHQEIDSDLYVYPDGDDANDGLSPTTALRTIHEGIYRIAADSLNQRTVHILPGTYSRTDNDQIFPIALKSWVKVKGNGIDSTTVICEPHPSIPLGYGSWDKIFHATKVQYVTLSDMTYLSRGTTNCGVIRGNKGSIVCLKNIRIDAICPEYAAIIRISSSSDRKTIWDNVTIENITTSNAGMINIDLPISGLITNSKFRNALSTYESASVWAPSLIGIVGDQTLEFANCQFSNLSMLDDNSNAITISGTEIPQQQNIFSFRNCLFSNNDSQGGIASIASYDNPRIDITNCTFTGNQGDTYTLITNGNVNITNTIFDNDTPYQIRVNPMNGNETTTLNIDYSCIKDGIAGIQQAPGNTINFLPTSISSDPLFAGGPDINDPLYYSLSAGSPCINTGTADTTGLNLPPMDLAGNYRVWDGRIDMGCYEYGSVPYVGVDDPELPAPPEGFRVSVYPNPLLNTNKAAGVFIEFTLPKEPMVQPVVEIFNIRGQKVKTIRLRESYNSLIRKAGLSGDVKQNGEFYSTVWNGRDDNNRTLASGTYIVKVMADQMAASTKITLIK